MRDDTRPQQKRMCSECQQHPAGFWYRGKFKSDKEHDLCPRCYDSAMQQTYTAQKHSSNP